MSQVLLVLTVFGRDEDDSMIDLRQRDIDDFATIFLTVLDGRFPFPIQAHHSEVFLNLW